MTFAQVLEKYRSSSFSQKDKGTKFEQLMQNYLQTDMLYAVQFANVWLWNEFPYISDFGGKDTGIDLVAQTHAGEFWAIQCKCFQASSIINKHAVDSFLSTSSRTFKTETETKTHFLTRLWISTTNVWGPNAEEAIHNQSPLVTRIQLSDLENSRVDWQKLYDGLVGEDALLPKKQPFEHQLKAIESAHLHYTSQNRGKLIMACGTGKTFTSLKIAEKIAPPNGMVLFLVPSIALLGQSLREWTAQASKPIRAICICSDAQVSKKKNESSEGETSTTDLALPASTDVNNIINQFKHIQIHAKDGLTVVFSTYQSIKTIAEVQKIITESNALNLEKTIVEGDEINAETQTPKPALLQLIFDLIICDEAHRTTGVTRAGEDDSAFVNVHDNDFIIAHRRLYMTATPRLYGEDAQSKAKRYDAEIWSMDDENIYGSEFFRIGFGEAVEKKMLTDYKVLILTLSESQVPQAVQDMIANLAESEIQIDMVSKLIGCVHAFSKHFMGDDGKIAEQDPEFMRSAVAFCSTIKDSKAVSKIFNELQKSYHTGLTPEQQAFTSSVESRHVDGGMPISLREKEITWLKKQNPTDKVCKILTNARCLSEGVDVPSLDAVIFLSPRDSQVDVVQSVGRVMRIAPGKKYGYIILPIVIPANIPTDQALDDNKKYKVVWSVLNALRAHDERFNAIVNQIELNRNKPDKINVVHSGLPSDVNEQKPTSGAQNSINKQMAMQFEGLHNIMFAKIVEKVGDRTYWETWAKNVANIAQRHITKITALVTENPKYQLAFDKFLSGLHKNINPSITQSEAIEMLSQHIITKPVFDALFENYSFVTNNPMSQSMQKMLDLLEEQSLEKDAETLAKFYESVKMRASGIDNAEGKQRIIIELYDKFFKTAFPKLVEKLGIVYSPVEVVDFIIHSINDILIKEFGRTISDENVHLLDPFTGTGTFITRLLQSGLINKEDLLRKYTSEIHCNEIVLLAYYIAAVNIENAFHDLLGKDATYKAFEGICLTDTFQLGESQDGEKLFSDMFPQNSKRVQDQQKAPLRIIMGNPPYSIGQSSANDNAQNQSYPKLDNRIMATYRAKSISTSATAVKTLRDSYIKAFRWSSDRLDKTGGIICFVSNGAWLEGNSTDGFRKSLEQEFTAIYVFNLRGNQRTSGELSRKEGGKIFGSGSRTPIAITLLVNNPDVKTEKSSIHYHDIGEYLTREEKLKIVNNFKSFGSNEMSLKIIHPNEQGDWISFGNDVFDSYIPLAPDKKFNLKSETFFNTYALGVATNRDAWAYNFSKKIVESNMIRMIEFYNNEVTSFHNSLIKNPNNLFDSFIDNDPNKISWTAILKNRAKKRELFSFDQLSLRVSAYRPFSKSNSYFNRHFNEAIGLSPKLFPKPEFKNVVICLTGEGSLGFSTLITNLIPDLCFTKMGNGGAQCFPLYYYEVNNATQKGMFDDENKQDFIRKDAISDFILERAKKQYGINVTKEDIFYYVYGFLHSPTYREMFANDLKKMLPRLPLVEDVKDFWAFSKAGSALAELHLNYETVAPFADAKVSGDTSTSSAQVDGKFYEVVKMRFPKKDQKDTIIYNSKITITNIPTQAYEYVVNGKSAIEWIMERYQVRTHTESGIKNDPNDWATEVGNPRYILDLLLSVINVSVQTVEIVNNLPVVEFE